ncbi:MAG: 16S rRNA (adenine(1518)-N(6)/adenine(1519)-N(6))-dimethyltransferase, partial [Betaproteobacteria bacterium AqS2]|nr:16S rRNA (adenine(1518)-N(6)/adenine(1519)-N(6))-dimethyltransferase [Betaproteobacteria bacterium AqS2]
GDAAKPWPAPAADPWRLAGNIPYAISSPVVERLLGLQRPPADVHLLLQLEFARRLVARPGGKDYSRFEVPAEAFAPPPRVLSAVVRLAPNRNAASIADPGLYAELLRQAFGQRRKQLRNSLAAMPVESLARYGGRRAEELEFADYVFMANELARARRG